MFAILQIADICTSSAACGLSIKNLRLLLLQGVDSNKALHVKNVKKTARHALITRCMRANEGMRHTNAEARKYIFLIFTNYISILL